MKIKIEFELFGLHCINQNKSSALLERNFSYGEHASEIWFPQNLFLLQLCVFWKDKGKINQKWKWNHLLKRWELLRYLLIKSFVSQLPLPLGLRVTLGGFRGLLHLKSYEIDIFSNKVWALFLLSSLSKKSQSPVKKFRMIFGNPSPILLNQISKLTSSAN